MVRKFILPVLALAGVLFAVWMVRQGSRPVPPGKPIAEPSRAPYEAKISGSGIVEASTRNIAVGTPVSGVVSRVFVQVAQRSQAGDPLFTLDDRKERAALLVKEKALVEARARLARLAEAPRPEEIPAARGRVQEAEAQAEDFRQQFEIVERVSDRRAISQDEVNKRRFALQAAEARLAQARASLELLVSGTWKADMAVAQAELSRAEAEVQASRVELDRLLVRAPVTGNVLQINVRPGEFALSGVSSPPLILLGDLDRLHVRVDIDENDAWRFRPQAPAVAFVRGNPLLKTDLTFEYLEPYVVPKKSLTGDSTERVDTRVMQVLYSFDRKSLPIYPGQLMDVYIQDRAEKTVSRTGPNRPEKN